MLYVDPNTIDNPTTDSPAPASWGDTVRDDLEFFAEPPQCSVSASSAESVSNSSNEVLEADSEDYDTDTMHSTSSNTSRITATTAGKYLCWFRVNFAGDATGQRRVNFLTNGGSRETLDIRDAVTGGGPLPTVASGSFSVELAATDYVEIEVWQNSGGALDVTLDEFGAVWQSR